MPHERTRRLAHPSSPSFHTSPGRGAKGAFPTGRWGTGRTRWPINLPKIGGHEQGRMHSGWRAHGQRCRLGGADATRQVCTVTQIWVKVLTARILSVTSGAFCPSPSCPHAPCLVHACANVLLAHVCHTSCV